MPPAPRSRLVWLVVLSQKIFAGHASRRHPEVPARKSQSGARHNSARASKDAARAGAVTPTSGLPEAGIKTRKSAAADLRWLGAQTGAPSSSG